jgi:hypothetical protein
VSRRRARGIDLVCLRRRDPLAAIGTDPVSFLLRRVAERVSTFKVARDGLGFWG